MNTFMHVCLDVHHASIRYRRTTHVTPKSYLSFLTGYKTIYLNQRTEIGNLAERMNTGLEKLVEASQSVAELSLELAEKEKELAIASAQAEEVLKEVSYCRRVIHQGHFCALTRQLISVADSVNCVAHDPQQVSVFP